MPNKHGAWQHQMVVQHPLTLIAPPTGTSCTRANSLTPPFTDPHHRQSNPKLPRPSLSLSIKPLSSKPLNTKSPNTNTHQHPHTRGPPSTYLPRSSRCSLILTMPLSSWFR
jgi:hypothetical protein